MSTNHPRPAIPSALPLISCIMATRDRRAFVPHSIECFLAQEYPERELVILDGGNDPIEDLVPPDERFHYIRLNGLCTIGSKYSVGIEHAALKGLDPSARSLAAAGLLRA